MEGVAKEIGSSKGVGNAADDEAGAAVVAAMKECYLTIVGKPVTEGAASAMAAVCQ